MSEKEDRVYEVLKQLDIPYIRFPHPPVFTVEQAEKHWKDIKGAHCKNIFVRNQKGDRHFLIIIEHKKNIDLKALALKIGQTRFSFASPERLLKYLGLEPGSVSPLGLINDNQKEVQVVIDSDLKTADYVNFHPNVNTVTLTLSYSDFERFLYWCGNKITYLLL